MILLDTSIAVRYLAGEEIAAVKAILKARKQRGMEPPILGVSAVSAGEILRMVRIGRLELTVDVHVWLEASQRTDRIRWIPVYPHIAIAAEEITEGDGIDMYDRYIAATARCFNAPLITANRRLHQTDAAVIDHKDSNAALRYVDLISEPMPAHLSG